MERSDASAADRRRSPPRSAAAVRCVHGVPARRPTPTTACSAPSSPARSRGPGSTTALPEGTEDVLAELEFNGGSVAGQGFGAFNAWGLDVRVEGGAQDGVGKTMLGGTVSIMKGKGRDGRARQRLGRQVVRLRRPARPPVRPGLGRLALLHPALGRRRRPRRRAGGAARRRARVRRRPRQRQGVRLRVHDLGPRHGARRHRALGLRRDDRRARLRAGSTRSGTSTARRSSAGSARAPRSTCSSSTPRASSTSRTCSATTRTSCGRPTRPKRPSGWPPSPRTGAHFLMIVPERVQADPNITHRVTTAGRRRSGSGRSRARRRL